MHNLQNKVLLDSYLEAIDSGWQEYSEVLQRKNQENGANDEAEFLKERERFLTLCGDRMKSAIEIKNGAYQEATNILLSVNQRIDLSMQNAQVYADSGSLAKAKEIINTSKVKEEADKKKANELCEDAEEFLIEVINKVATIYLDEEYIGGNKYHCSMIHPEKGSLIGLRDLEFWTYALKLSSDIETDPKRKNKYLTAVNTIISKMKVVDSSITIDSLVSKYDNLRAKYK